MAVISKKSWSVQRVFTRERIDIGYATTEVARDKRFVESLQWRSEEIFFAQENIAEKHYTHGLKKIAYLFRSRRHFGENWKLYSAVIKKVYASKEVKENALASEGKSCRPENNNYSQSIYMSWPLSVKHAAKITFAQYKCRTFQSTICPADKNDSIGISSILAWGKSRVGLPPPFIVVNVILRKQIGMSRSFSLSPPPPPSNN